MAGLCLDPRDDRQDACRRGIAPKRSPLSQPDRALVRLVLGAGRRPPLHLPIEPGRQPDRVHGTILDRQDALGAGGHFAALRHLVRAHGRTRRPATVPGPGAESHRAGRIGLWYLSISGAPIFGEDGRFKGYQGTGRNITERKRIEEELRSRQEMLDLAQRSAGAVPWQWRYRVDAAQNQWSSELEAMFGVPAGSFDGTSASWRKLVHRGRLARGEGGADARAQNGRDRPRISRGATGRLHSLAAAEGTHADGGRRQTRALDRVHVRRDGEAQVRGRAGATREAAAPRAAPGVDGYARGWHRARLQQHPRRNPGLRRDGAARCAQGKPPAPRPGQHHDGRRARSRADRSHSRVQPQRRQRARCGARRAGGARGDQSAGCEVAGRRPTSR